MMPSACLGFFTWQWKHLCIGMLLLGSFTVAFTLLFSNIYWYNDWVNIAVPLTSSQFRRPSETRTIQTNKTYIINWYNPPPYLDYQFVRNISFETCEYSNCVMTYGINNATSSAANIFEGQFVPKHVGFKRPRDQVWIYGAHESPMTYVVGRQFWRTEQHWRTGFNWTMTYNKYNTDIFLPYGELRKYLKPIVRDFKKIANEKHKDFIWVASHCHTHSKREQYVKLMTKDGKLNIDIYGSCGKKSWNCGLRYEHQDECYKPLVAPYKFYLAFENAYCHQYFTEKFYANFNYDIILVSLGGSQGEAIGLFPNGTFIATDSFKTVKDLVVHLKTLLSSEYAYAEMLEKKSQYYNLGFKYCYQRAMCDICKRVNNVDLFRKQIPDIVKWAYNNTPCITKSII